MIALPFLVVLASGLLLQVKKEFSWIQPPTQEGTDSNQPPRVSFTQILELSGNISEASIQGWDDIDRLDVRPDKGIVKVRSKTNWEIQLDLATGKVLSSMKRRSGIIESIHDGSWFHDKAKLWIFLPSAIIVTVLWITGIYLFFLPYFARRQNRKRLALRIRKRRRQSEQPAESGEKAEAV